MDDISLTRLTTEVWPQTACICLDRCVSLASCFHTRGVASVLSLLHLRQGLAQRTACLESSKPKTSGQPHTSNHVFVNWEVPPRVTLDLPFTRAIPLPEPRSVKRVSNSLRYRTPRRIPLDFRKQRTLGRLANLWSRHGDKQEHGVKDGGRKRLYLLAKKREVNTSSTENEHDGLRHFDASGNTSAEFLADLSR